MSLAKKFAIATLATAVLFTGLATQTPANAASLTKQEAALLAGAGGFVLGTLIANSHQRRHTRVIYVEDSWDAHVSRCLARYNSYDPSTDTYLGYDGYEHTCRL